LLSIRMHTSTEARPPVLDYPLGVASHLFRGTPEVVAAACRRYGLTCVQLTPNFPGLSFQEPGGISPERCRRAAAPFLAAGLPVAGLFVPANLLDANLHRRHCAIVRLHALLCHCRDFGTDRCVTETGSLGPGTAQAGCSPEAWAELRLILAEALRVAADHGVTLLLKPEPTHALASIEDVLRLREELPYANLGFVLDPVNFLLHSKPADLNSALERLVGALGPWSPLVHAKDICFEGGGVSAPRAGCGVLDYRLFLRLLRRYQPAAPIILVHLQPHEVPQACAYLRSRWQALRDAAGGSC
jgi:sugar phosphate isomerase/epimerase